MTPHDRKEVAGDRRRDRGTVRRVVPAAAWAARWSDRKRAETEDVVQEAFVRGLDHPRRLLGAGDPEAWLRTVAVNHAPSRWRRAQRLLGRAPRLVEEPGDGDTGGHLALPRALRTHSAGQREVVALHYLADLTVEQVTDTLDLPTVTVKARLSRSRVALSTLLFKEGTHV